MPRPMADTDDLPITVRYARLTAIILGATALCMILVPVTPQLQFSLFHLDESFGTLVVLISTLALAALHLGATLHHLVNRTALRTEPTACLPMRAPNRNPS